MPQFIPPLEPLDPLLPLDPLDPLEPLDPLLPLDPLDPLLLPFVRHETKSFVSVSQPLASVALPELSHLNEVCFAAHAWSASYWL